MPALIHNMLDELRQIPDAANLCYSKNSHIKLPSNVPYIGMGSSWIAPVVMKYCGLSVMPEIASEYFHYLDHQIARQKAVLISQSGRSSETLWCANRFESVVAITNDRDSPLAKHGSARVVIDLEAGEEKFSSGKTYINTLIALYLGLGIDPLPAINYLSAGMEDYKLTGMDWAEHVYSSYKGGRWKGSYILGNGPNIGTALQAALVLTESSGLPFQAMPMAQYDHGPKESADRSIVFIIPGGKQPDQRMTKLSENLKQGGAEVFIHRSEEVTEKLSPLINIIPFLFTCHYLAEKLERKQPFLIGNKITESDI